MKRIFTLIAAAIILRLTCPAQVHAAEKPGYVYTIINNQATVTGFEGEPVFIEIPEFIEGCRVVELRDNAFYECSSLRHITLPGSVEKIGHHCFYGCDSLESISIPDSVTDIGMGAFCGCPALSSVSLPESIGRLPESCFRSCISLRSVTIPESVTEIGDFCFSGCTSLTAVSLGSRTRELGDCAFFMCTAMDAVYIPGSVEEIGLCAVGYIPTNSGADRKEGFTILGEKKSAAERYAKDNELTFEKAPDPVHAFAIQRITGRRIGIPTIYIAGGAAVVFLAGRLLPRRRPGKKR